MMLLLTILVGLVAHQVSGVYVNLQALNANGGRRGGGERVVAVNGANKLVLVPYSKHNANQKFEKLDGPGNKFYLYKQGDISKRVTMLATQRFGLNDVGMTPEKNSGAELLKQSFVLNGPKKQILCNGGERINGRLYTLQYKSGGVTVHCGPAHDRTNEEFALVSTRAVTLDNNQFFVVNKAIPDIKYGKVDNTGAPLLLRGPYSPKVMWTFKKGPGNKFSMWNVQYPSKKLMDLMALLGQLYLYRFEKVIDNVGDEWDFYKINEVMFNRKLTTESWKPQHYWAGDKQLWRFVPRFVADDDGYVMMHRERGNPTDVEIVTKWSKGLTVSSGSEISSKTGVSVSVKLAVEKGIFAASLESTVTHEVEQVQTSSSSSTWSKETSISRVYPKNQDCTLFQRKVSYTSALSADSMTQTPNDFKMVCV